jgi:hypothetical protein
MRQVAGDKEKTPAGAFHLSIFSRIGAGRQNRVAINLTAVGGGSEHTTNRRAKLGRVSANLSLVDSLRRKWAICPVSNPRRQLNLCGV